MRDRAHDHRRARSAALVALALLAGGCGGSGGPHIDVGEPTAIDEPVRIRVHGLEPRSEAKLTASWRSADDSVWKSQLQLTAGDDGGVTVGSEVLTEMRPPADEDFFVPRQHDNRIPLRLTAGDENVQATLVRDAGPKSLLPTQMTVAADGIAALYFEPERATGRGVVVLGGSEGGYEGFAAEAQQLAVHGHPALVLGYFGLPGLPASIDRIAIETVTRGVRWLEQRADGPVALMGGSLGGELALLAAALEPTLTDCVVARVPGSRVSPGEAGKSAWAWRGKPVRPRELIPVERIRGRVLAAGAEQDTAWLSASYVSEVARHIRAGGRASIDVRVYEQAGHLIAGLPYLPEPDDSLYGGTTRANAAARADLWPRVLRFLSRGSGS